MCEHKRILLFFSPSDVSLFVFFMTKLAVRCERKETVHNIEAKSDYRHCPKKKKLKYSTK